MIKRFVLFLALCVGILSAFVSAQYNIGFVEAEQFQTVAGWRLQVTPDWSGIWFPPSDYEGAKLLLSTLPMGHYPPYDAIAILQTNGENRERDPEFKLLGKMETNRLWYGRLFFYYGGGQIYAQTPEFTFTLTDQVLYKGHSIWATSDFGWTSSFVFLNPGTQVAHLSLAYYYQNGYVVPDKTTTVTINPGAEYVFILNNVFPGFGGRVEFSCVEAPIEWWEYIYDGYGGSAQFQGTLVLAN